MLIKNLDGVAVWSENWKELADWYERVFEMEAEEELNLPDDTGRLYKIGECVFWIGAHSEVKGKSKDKYRIMPGFVFESVHETAKILKERGVEFIAEPHLSPTKDYHAATIEDLDGNIIQMYSFDVNENTN